MALMKSQQTVQTTAETAETAIKAAAEAVGIEIKGRRGNLYLGAQPVKSAPVVNILVDGSIYETIFIGPHQIWTQVSIIPDDQFPISWNPYTKANAGVWKDVARFDFLEMLKDIKKRSEMPPEPDGPAPF